jgi:hypothetical protein
MGWVYRDVMGWEEDGVRLGCNECMMGRGECEGRVAEILVGIGGNGYYTIMIL